MRCFSLDHHGRSLSFVLKRGQQHKETWVGGLVTEKMAVSLDKTDAMAQVLKRLTLGHLTDQFQREKITPAISSMLSTH